MDVLADRNSKTDSKIAGWYSQNDSQSSYDHYFIKLGLSSDGTLQRSVAQSTGWN